MENIIISSKPNILNLFKYKIFNEIDYTNKIIIQNIPYNEIYTFRVAVYGINFTDWSEFSYPSLPVDMKIRKH